MIQPEVQWLKIFGRWLMTLASAPKLPKPLIMYERRAGESLDAKLSLLPDSDSRFRQRPGAIATWSLITKEAPHAGVFFTLDNLIQLDQQTNQIEIKRGLQRSLGMTHRFQVSWVIKPKEQFRFVIIDSFDIDLTHQYIDEAPREIMRHVALEAFNLRPVEGLHWRDRIYHFPWLDAIQYIAPKKGCPEQPRFRRLCKRIQKVTFS
jgi:hypothetical protein